MKECVKIAIWGMPPPPIGGMSVHIERLSQRFSKEGLSYEFYNFTGKPHPKYQTREIPNLVKWYFGLLFVKSPQVHYVITTRASIRFLASLLGVIRNKKVIIRVGGKSLENEINSGKSIKYLNIAALKFCSAFIGVNKEICMLASSYTNSDKVHHIPGFIPPVIGEELPPNSVKTHFDSGGLKIIVSGKVTPKNEFDIYGLWDMILLGNALRGLYPEFRLVVFAYDLGIKNTVALNEYLNEIKANALEKNIFVFNEYGELWPSILYADIFLRPSYTDGDCNALREALALNVLAIASDVVPRPGGTIIYPSKDIDKLVKIIHGVVDNMTTKLPSPNIQDNSIRIVKLVKELCSVR